MKTLRSALLFSSLAVALSMGWLPFARAAATATLTVVHSFDGSDGGSPLTGLIQGSDGNFYGTAGGDYESKDTFFRLTPDGKLTVLYTFATGANDDAGPTGLIQGSDGNFYGTTDSGGSGSGTVFRLTPGGEMTVLHAFSRDDDGAYPQGGLIQGSDGSFYGATRTGGGHDAGTIFRITSEGVCNVLHAFGDRSTAGNLEGASPCAVVESRDGNFYGTTRGGGAEGEGTVFRLSPGGDFATLHSFTGRPGAYPEAGLTQGVDGIFYGTASKGDGISGSTWRESRGTVFSITAAGALSTLHAFADVPVSKSPGEPLNGLCEGRDGNFYGATDDGTLFSVTPGGEFSTLYQLATEEGSRPAGTLLQGSDGSFYGTTFAGGASGKGVIFKLTVIPATLLPPEISSASSAATDTEVPFNYVIAASHDPTSFAASGLPTGLSLNPVTGLISGTLKKVGVYTLALSAANAAGASATVPLTLTVTKFLPSVRATVYGLTSVQAGSGNVARISLFRSGDLSKELVVSYKVKGSAVPGVDYTTLKGTAKFKPYQVSRAIKIVPLDGAGGTKRRPNYVKVVLLPSEQYRVTDGSPIFVGVYGQ